jgi:hypothetical protein
MGNFEALARRFAEADLRAEVIDRAAPQTWRFRDAPGIFQMDVAGRGRDEWFRVWPGARQNRVEALGLDREQRQLVLLVQEPVRTFTQQLRKHAAEVDRRRVKVIAEDELHLWVERRTEARKRHFLCGRDERQLFICQLPRPLTTVREAHAALRTTVPAGVKGKVVRQGEWFFLAPSANELAAMDAALRAFRTVVRTRVPIGRGGNPHVADELVLVPPTSVGEVQVPRLLLSRGRVRHVDHDTVKLPSWAKVVRNAEPVADDGIARMDGVRWID